jgi:hypothetical protein
MAVEGPHQLIDVLGHEWLEGREGDFLFCCETKKSFAGFPVVDTHGLGLLPARRKCIGVVILSGGKEGMILHFKAGHHSIQQLIGQT